MAAIQALEKLYCIPHVLNESGIGFELGPQSIYGLIEGTDESYLQSNSEMPHYNCCVPGCTNSFRNASHLHFYRLPKDEFTRKQYKVILKNDSLKLDSTNTRICSDHFEGGEKLSRAHLPTIFPWKKAESTRRQLKRVISFEENLAIQEAKKKKREEKKDMAQASVTVEHENNRETQTSLTGLEIETMLKELQKLKKDISELTNEKNQLLEKNAKLSEENANLLEANLKLEQETKRLRHSLENFRFDIEKYKDNAEDIAFYTGLPDYNALLICFDMVKDAAEHIEYEHERTHPGIQCGRPRCLTKFQEFTLTLVRLRLGLLEKDLAHRFSVSRPLVSKVSRAWTRFLRGQFEPLITIPPREVLKLYMPDIFKSFYPDCVIIVDCTEFEMEKPSALNSQSACYSSYKSRTTMKALLGITPSGALCFVSELFPGSTSDKEITAQSGLLDKLQPYDQVMADKGFNCTDELASVGAELIRPAFLVKDTQFSKEETNHNKIVASLRVHVERLMERIKNWHIFDHRIPITLAPIASDMLFVVAGLSNFYPPLIN